VELEKEQLLKQQEEEQRIQREEILKEKEWLENFKRQDQFCVLHHIFMDRNSTLRHANKDKALAFVINKEYISNFDSTSPFRKETKWIIIKKDNYKIIYTDLIYIKDSYMLVMKIY
jgi:hypothetical protein